MSKGRSNWKINGKESIPHTLARKGGVYPITPTKEVKKIEHDEVFYFWVESILSINKIDTDEEIRKRFLERMGDDEATFYLGQRRKALKEGSSFKLERFEGRRLSDDEFSSKVLSRLGSGGMSDAVDRAKKVIGDDTFIILEVVS